MAITSRTEILGVTITELIQRNVIDELTYTLHANVIQ